jgi:hypothetical protein
MLQKLAEVPVASTWRERLLAPEVEDLSVSWGLHLTVSRSAGAIGLDVPADPTPTSAPQPAALCARVDIVIATTSHLHSGVTLPHLDGPIGQAAIPRDAW